jgi:hypothetical protein
MKNDTAQQIEMRVHVRQAEVIVDAHEMPSRMPAIASRMAVRRRTRMGSTPTQPFNA